MALVSQPSASMRPTKALARVSGDVTTDATAVVLAADATRR
jgi:hypothetical protein